MPTFTDTGPHMFVSYITGPSHIRLGLRFCDRTVSTPTLIRQPPAGNCTHEKILESSLLEAVRAGVSSVDPALSIAEVVYIENDSPNYSLFKYCARLLAERHIQGLSRHKDAQDPAK